MRIKEISGIDKLFFSPQDVARACAISDKSANVLCSRYVSNGILLRIKRNYYVISERWKYLNNEDIFVISNLLEVPSYISLTTALAYYDVTTQVQRDFFEAISIKRTKEIVVKERSFTFTKIDKKLYKGFVKENGYFIATPEKALLDAVYLTSLKRYYLDFDALDLSKVKKNNIRGLLEMYPEKVKTTWREHVGPI